MGRVTSASPIDRGPSLENVACPFCSLGCDDLVFGDEQAGIPSLIDHGCVISKAMFSAAYSEIDNQPKICGSNVPIQMAVERAAALLQEARLPVLGGLATDVAGIRASLRLADRVGAIVDHLNSDQALRNLRVVQDKGWISTTLSEVRNRADLVVILGGDVQQRFPRFVERCVAPTETLFASDLSRHVVMLGGVPPPLGNIPTTQIDCERSHMAELAGALRSLIDGRSLQAPQVAGIDIRTIRALAQRMKQARYGVFVWAAADLDFPHAELAVEAICDLVKTLNLTTRFSVLPLTGAAGDVTANQVATWQTGFPVRSAFSRGFPEYDPYHFSATRLVANGQADALLWISALDRRDTPPPSDTPTVVLGCAGMTFNSPPEVFIPIGTPGLDHGGHVYRTDNVVALRLRQLVDRGLPSAADILLQIERALDTHSGDV